MKRNKHFKHIRGRIALFMFALTMLSLGISWLVTFLYFYKTISDQVIKDNTAIVQQVADRITGELEYVADYATTMSYDKSLISAMKELYGETGFKRRAAEQRVMNLVSDYAVLSKKIVYHIYIADKTVRNTIGAGGKIGVQDLVITEPWFQDIVESGQVQGFTPLHNTPERTASHRKVETISFVRSILDFGIGEAVLGRLVVDLDLPKLFMGFHGDDELSQRFCLVDENQQAIYAGNGVTIPAGLNSWEAVQRIGRDYYISVPVPPLDSTLISVIPKARIDRALGGSMLVLFFSLLCGLAIASIFALMLSKSITRPIVRLSSGMKQAVNSKYKLQLEVEGQDELADMTVMFNNMQEESRQLMEINRQMGKRDRELRMKYFMSKINPHFIYNTLNCVIYLARKQKSGEIIPLTRALIAILKTNIATGEKPIRLQEEIDYLIHYFSILKYRYNDEIQICFRISPELTGLSIQPMILYPLVENSVFHGIAPAGRPGLVTVSVAEEGGRVRFAVEDDGVGMNRETVDCLKRYISSESERSIYGSIGLKNVNDRLRLFYSSCQGLEISVGQGSKVGFSILLEELEQDGQTPQ